MRVGLLLVFAADHLQPKIVVGFGWLAQMERLSYEICLSHMFIVLKVCSIYRARFSENMQWAFWVYIPTIFLCVLLGSLLEVNVSLPAMNWLRSRNQ